MKNNRPTVVHLAYDERKPFAADIIIIIIMLAAQGSAVQVWENNCQYRIEPEGLSPSCLGQRRQVG